MDLLCVAAEADPTGYVLVNGRTPTTTDLARLTGEPEAALQSALEELERNGVFSRDRNGRIYNRRMVRDIKRIANNRKNGKLGGNPNLSKQTEKSRSDNPSDNPSDKAKKPEARSQEEDGSPKESLKQDNESSKAAQAPPLYAFVGKVIRLVPKQFETWRNRYHGIADIQAYLGVLDDFYATLPADEQKNWFIRCSAALDKKHQEALALKAKASIPIEKRYPNEGVYA